MSSHDLAYLEPEKIKSIDSEFLSGKRYPYQEDMSLLDDVDLMAATPGEDLNWLEDIALLEEDGVPAVFDRYSNAFLKIYFDIPDGREDEIARKVLVKHLTSGNSYGIQLKADHTKFPQPELGPWVDGLEDGRHGLHAARPRGLGEARGPLRTTKPPFGGLARERATSAPIELSAASFEVAAVPSAVEPAAGA